MDDASGAEGQWIAVALERYLTKELWDQWIGTVATTVPDTFEAYARIFHPLGGHGEPELRWADVARAKGTRMHPEAQFHRLARTELYAHLDIDGVSQTRPTNGELDQRQLVALSDVLGAHTAEHQDIFQAVWVGWGGFEPGAGSIPTGPGGPLTVAKGLREYWVFRGTIAELARPPWCEEGSDEDGPGANTQSANLAWPADRSWCMATEIDFDSTLVGGTAELIAAVVHSKELEAMEVTPASNLSSEGDQLNTPPRPSVP
ncbi:hypothetical protein ART_1721 [Arthrobacter sp. PAMC 25486]|uniref:hypothetical protein n=1 Tax=Arthrobacter sp. PAMC 25486 TaxID=1494608 RepID=UPI0005359CA5|nr:hypothetical protein [Arthrobacter sp. PAMC 25486]AIY01320.1 hypothetical protein ART_1721 [Arthrobacter sp. PAMC 25486]